MSVIRIFADCFKQKESTSKKIMLNFVMETQAQAIKIPLQQVSSAAVMSVMQEAKVVQIGTVNVSAVRTLGK